MKRYRLKLPHPYAKAGTMVEEYSRSDEAVLIKINSDRLDTFYCSPIPLPVVNDWLEEVKEEVTFTKDQIVALREQLKRKWLDCDQIDEWLDAHTSKDE